MMVMRGYCWGDSPSREHRLETSPLKSVSFLLKGVWPSVPQAGAAPPGAGARMKSDELCRMHQVHPLPGGCVSAPALTTVPDLAPHPPTAETSPAGPDSNSSSEVELQFWFSRVLLAL